MNSSHFYTTQSKFNLKSDGYIVIAPLSQVNKNKIYKFQESIKKFFPDNSIWFPKKDQLHVTFAHIISPDSKYSSDKKTIFKRLKADVEKSLHNMASTNKPLLVNFSKIRIFEPSIIIQGFDNGTIDNLRTQFITSFKLPNESRKPPNIIHITLARFKKKIDIAEAKDAIELSDFNFTETTKSLRLIHELKIYVQKQTTIAEYYFNGTS